MSKILFDPRTVARDIPGIFDNVFPQLTPGVVAHFNRQYTYISVEPVAESALDASKMTPAMLAELAFALGEKRISGESDDWNLCLDLAVARQRRHFDAVIPAQITDADKKAANALARNMEAMIGMHAAEIGAVPAASPAIPGYEWIASGVGDFAIGKSLVEIKFSSRNFSSADYRQVVIYWLLDFLVSLEIGTPTWSEFVLMNPRQGKSVRSNYMPFINMISGGRTLVEISQIFSSVISTRSRKNP